MGVSGVVIPFDDALSATHSLVGGKATSLGRLTKAGFPVPPGFTISTAAYAAFMTSLKASVAAMLAAADYDRPEHLEEQSARIRALIVDSALPADIASAITEAYALLGGNGRPVAVRSSGTAEDLAEASFAGLHDTFLDIAGEGEVLVAVKRCWASLWTTRAIHYRHDKGFAHEDALLAVIVQRMIPSAVAGVMFTANPLNLRTDEFVINASWGLGEGIVSGILTPDEFVVDRATLKIKARILGTKELQIVKNPTGPGTVRQAVPAEQQAKFALTDPAVNALAALGQRVMAYYEGLPQDIEWGFADDRFYLLQSRRVTGAEFTWDEDINATIPARHDDSTVWTSTWADDFLTGGVTPLYYSVRVGGEFQCVHDHTNKVYGFPQLAGRLIFKFRRATAVCYVPIPRCW